MPPIEFKLQRGYYQNNGASPWFSPVAVGSQKTVMKLSLDTGTNMNWVTSTLCNTPACTQAGRVRFDPDASSSYLKVGFQPKTLDYGPWGKLQAQIGSDMVHLPSGGFLEDIGMGLAIDYHGEKFREVDWDGCIAMPAQGPMQDNMSFFFEGLRDAGKLTDRQCYLTYYTDAAAGTGVCTLGGVDPSQFDPSSMLLLKFEEYQDVEFHKPISYIWTTPLASAVFGGVTICTNKSFCLDTGSSRFKGDGTFMNHILSIAAGNPKAELELEVGMTSGGRTGQLVVPPSIYNQLIERGTGAGLVEPQFAELKHVPNLFLAGSVLLDHLYLACIYTEEPGPVLKPQGMVIFNRKNGPRIIQNGLAISGDAETFYDEIQTHFAELAGGN